MTFEVPSTHPTIVLTKPICFLETPVVPVGEITPRATIIKYPMPRKAAKIPWWKRLIRELLGV